ncbi:MAG: KH domain-containing protein [Eubacteriales bacterium]
MTDLKQILTDIAASLVDQPDEVEVVVVDEDENEMTLELRVAEGDMGKVIGRRGRIANAIRAVMWSAANAAGKKVKVDIR